MNFEHRSAVPFDRGKLWDFLMDVPRVATCIPGVAEVAQLDERTYRGVMKIRVGPISLSLEGKITLEETDSANWRASMQAEAVDRKVAGGLRAKMGMVLNELGSGETELVITTNAALMGKIGELGQPIVRKKADSILADFLKNIAQALPLQSS